MNVDLDKTVALIERMAASRTKLAEEAIVTHAAVSAEIAEGVATRHVAAAEALARAAEDLRWYAERGML